MKVAPLILMSALLAACSTTGPVAPPSKVVVPVAADCVPPHMPPAPSYPDTDPALVRASDAAERYRLLILGREVRVARLGLLEGVVDACRGATN